MRRRLVASMLVVLAVAGAVRASARKQIAIKAEESFFRALNHEPRTRAAAMRELLMAYVSDPADGRTTLLLGLGHLWTAAEGDRTNPANAEHVLLARHYLERAQKLRPDDRRIPSWLVPARLAVAGIERDMANQARIRGDLAAAYKQDPNFHSFSMAMLAFGNRRDSEDFQSGLRVLRSAIGCAENDPSCMDMPRWPHNIEGFLIFVADFELKAGRTEEARATLESVKKRPEYATFAYPEEVEDRLANLERYAALYANADAGDDPPPIVSGPEMCQVCHRTR
jgi:hypothetical protein